MTSTPYVDYSDEIRDFRRVLSWTLTQKNNVLEKELTRIGRIIKAIEDSGMLKTNTPASPSYEKNDDKTNTTHVNPMMRRRLEMVTRLLSEVTGIPTPLTKEGKKRLEYRMELIQSFLRNTREDMDYVRSFYVLRSTLQFAVMKKKISNLTCDDTIIRPYTDFIPTPNEIAEFLVYYWWYAPELTRWFLTNLSSKYRTLAVLHAVCDNTYKYQIEEEREHALSKVEDMILNLGNDQIALSKDINVYMVALNDSVLQSLASIISIAQKIDNGSIFINTLFPLNEDQIKDLKFGSVVFSTNPEGMDTYRNALTEALHNAVEQGHISTSEYDAVTGVVAAQSPFARENEHPVSTTDAPVIPPQAELGGDAATGNEGTETEEVIKPRIQPAVVHSASNPRSVLKSHRVTRPPMFAGSQGERAFRHLYLMMQDVYFECVSLDNFTGLFRCPSDETVESYTKINWIHRTGQYGLKWFLEALYRSKRDERGSAFRMRNELSNLFLVKGKLINLQSNPIYCWKRDFKSVDASHEHEQRIQEFRDLMDQADIEARENK